MSLSSLFFFLNIVSAIQGLLQFHMNLRVGFFRKGRQNFDGDCIESVGHFGE